MHRITDTNNYNYSNKLNRRQLHLSAMYEGAKMTFCDSLMDMLLSCHSIPLFQSHWLASIAATTVLLRTVFFPIKLSNYRNQHRMIAAQQEYAQRVAPLLARKPFATEMERAAAQRQELTKHFSERGVSLLKMMSPVVVNVPLFLGMSAVLRTEGVFGSGWEWLGAGDWRMALATCMTNAVVLHCSRRFMQPPPTNTNIQLQQPIANTSMSKMMVPFLHVINAASFFLLQHMPAAVTFYVAVSGVMTYVENVAVRLPIFKWYVLRPYRRAPVGAIH